MLDKNATVWLYGNIDDKSYTTHSFHRSTTTALAEAGISVVTLCHTERWGSAQEYQEDTGHEKTERPMMLDKGEYTEINLHKKRKVKLRVKLDLMLSPYGNGIDFNSL